MTLTRGGLLLLAFSLAVALSLPLTNVPVIDDWAYAFSVEQLLKTGQFRILEYSCRYNLVQVVWGALFSLPAGASFAALRFSTLVLAVPGLLCFFDLLRRRTGDDEIAVWVAALLAFNPLFFRLALSFMTDVPLIALVSISFWLFARGLESSRTFLLLGATAIVVAAYLVRELAVVAPVALVAGAFMSAPARASTPVLAALVLLTAVGFAAELWWIAAVRGPTWGLTIRTEGLRYLLDVPAMLYVSAFLQMLLTVAALVAPLALATVRSRNDLAWAVLGALVFGGAALLVAAVPFGAHEVLSPLGLGMSRALLPGAAEVSTTGTVLRGFILLLAGPSLAILLREFVLFVGNWWSTRDAIDTAWILFGLGEVSALMILWLWQDRYDLILVPSALWLLALRARREGWGRGIVIAGVAAFTFVSVLGTRDDFELNRAAWEAEQMLRDDHVPASAIDGGYALNGWRLYAQTMTYAPEFPPERVPFLFSKDQLPYLISTTPLDGTDVLQEYSWPRTWLSQPRLFALRRTG